MTLNLYLIGRLCKLHHQLSEWHLPHHQETNNMGRYQNLNSRRPHSLSEYTWETRSPKKYTHHSLWTPTGIRANPRGQRHQYRGWLIRPLNWPRNQVKIKPSKVYQIICLLLLDPLNMLQIWNKNRLPAKAGLTRFMKIKCQNWTDWHIN